MSNSRKSRLGFAVLASVLLACCAAARQQVSILGRVVPTSTGGGSGGTIGTFQFANAGWDTQGIVVPQGMATGDGSTIQFVGLTTQVDVKTTWPADGSVRFAVVTANIPLDHHDYVLTASGTAASGTFTPASLPTSTTTLANLDGTGHDYVATLSGTRGTDCWLDGPLVKECRQRLAPVYMGTPHDSLRVTYDVRTYNDGEQRVDVQVCNCILISTSDRHHLTPSIVIDGSTVYSHAEVHQALGMAWRQVFAVDGFTFNGYRTEAPPIYDFSSAVTAHAIPKWRSTITNTTTYNFGIGSGDGGYGYDILETGEAAPYLEDPGNRAEIGPYPDWAARYAVHPDNLNYWEATLRNGDSQGSYSFQLAESSDGITPYSAINHVNFVAPGIFQGTGQDSPNDGLVSPFNGFGYYDPNVWQFGEDAHTPSWAFIPYLVTGDRYYADELRYMGSFAISFASVPERGTSPNLSFDPRHPNPQPRGVAWGLRNITDAALYLPDADPWQATLRTVAEAVVSRINFYGALGGFGTGWHGRDWQGSTLNDVTGFNNDYSPAVVDFWKYQFFIDWAMRHAKLGGIAETDVIDGSSAHAGAWLSRVSFNIWLINQVSDPAIQAMGYEIRDLYESAQLIIVGVRDHAWCGIDCGPDFEDTDRVQFYTDIKTILDDSCGGSCPGPHTGSIEGGQGQELRNSLIIGEQLGMSGATAALDAFETYSATLLTSMDAGTNANNPSWALQRGAN